MPDFDTCVIYRSAPRRLRRRELDRFADLLRNSVAGGRDFACLITDDKEVRRLNREFRGKDTPTDVLSFPAYQSSESTIHNPQSRRAERGALGDIAISAERAAEQARERDHSLEDEIRVLMLHGVLHLLGMDHETDRGRMAHAERRYSRELGLAEGLIERMRT